MLNSCSSCEKIKNTTLLTIPSTNRRMANSIPLTHIHDHSLGFKRIKNTVILSKRYFV